MVYKWSRYGPVRLKQHHVFAIVINDDALRNWLIIGGIGMSRRPMLGNMPAHARRGRWTGTVVAAVFAYAADRIGRVRRPTGGNCRHCAEAHRERPEGADRNHGLHRRDDSEQGSQQSSRPLEPDAERQPGRRRAVLGRQFRAVGVDSRHRSGRLRLQPGSGRRCLPGRCISRAHHRCQPEPVGRGSHRNPQGSAGYLVRP